MVAQFLEPSCNVYVCCVFGDIVDKERTDRAAVITVKNKGLAFKADSGFKEYK